MNAVRGQLGGLCQLRGRWSSTLLAGCLLLCQAGRWAIAQPGGPPSIPATPVRQFNGNPKPITMPPNRPASRRDGLVVSVDPRWSNYYGYWPVQVTATALKPAAATRVITIRLHGGWMRSVSAEQKFELPAGSTTASTTVSVPIYQTNMNYFWWEVWVDGRYDEDLSLDQSGGAMRSGGAPSNPGAGVVFLTVASSGNSRSLVSTNASELQVLTLALPEFPTRWIDYTALDVVAMSLGDAHVLKETQPQCFEAMCRWVRSGGQLWIYDAGAKWENLADVSELLEIAPALADAEDARETEEATPAEGTPAEKKETPPPANEVASPQRVAQEGWRPLRFRRFRPDGQVITFMDRRTGERQTTRDPEVIQRLEADGDFVTTEQRFETDTQTPERRFTADSNEWFVEQPMGLGVARAFREGNDVERFPLTPPPSNPNAVANSDAPDELPRALSIGLRRARRWDMRHGMAPDTANVEFAKMLVPGVGLAPVTEFRVLITLFVLAIGPLNYWLLKRAKRLHLMVLTVPAAAMVATLALFTYAVLADGFDTRYRARSFTKLDQRSGEAVCWSWLSYYSGLAPGDGLVIPADVAIFPILPSWLSDTSGETRELVWAGDEARLKQGWLNSRTPTQYLTVRSRKSPIALEVFDSGDKLRVKNRLGANLLTLVVISRDGKTYFGEDVVADGSRLLSPVARDEAIRRLSKVVTDHMPQAPDALSTGDQELAALRARSRYGIYGRYGQQFVTGKLTENLAGTTITNLAGLGGVPALDLPAKSYLAITDRGPEVAVGIEEADEEASFHVIEGRW